MSKWGKYASMTNASDAAKEQRKTTSQARRNKQLDTVLGVWAFSQPNSLIRVAKVFRCMAKEVGHSMSFDESIEKARNFSKGRLQ